MALAISDRVTDKGVPTKAKAMPTKYKEQPPVYIQRRGTSLVAQGTMSPQIIEISPTMK